jgi:hypothetical protein
VLRLVDGLTRRAECSGAPSLTEFGARFHGRFSGPMGTAEGRGAQAPRCSGFGDPDYLALIRPYTSREPGALTTQSSLFRCLPGSIRRGFYYSTDWLWSLRLPLDEEECGVLSQLSRWRAVPRASISASDDVLRGLVSKGLVGISIEADRAEACHRHAASQRCAGQGTIGGTG